jgi:hypothetical protein
MGNQCKHVYFPEVRSGRKFPSEEMRILTELTEDLSGTIVRTELKFERKTMQSVIMTRIFFGVIHDFLS